MVKEMMKTNSKKFEITDVAHEKYPFLHRIRAMRDVGIEVRAGDLGGFVEGAWNLTSDDPNDASWIFDDAICAGSAVVEQNSCLRGQAIACDDARVTERSSLSGHARAEDQAYIRGSVLTEYARVSDAGMVLNSPDTGKFPKLGGHCVVYGLVAGDIQIKDAAVVLRAERISNDTRDTLVIDQHGRSMVRDPSRDELKPYRPPEIREQPKRKRKEPER